jgi:hypothetical protein
MQTIVNINRTEEHTMTTKKLIISIAALFLLQTFATAATIDLLPFSSGEPALVAAAKPVAVELEEFRRWRDCENKFAEEILRRGFDRSSREANEARQKRTSAQVLSAIDARIAESAALDNQVIRGEGWAILPSKDHSACSPYPLGSGEIFKRVLFLAQQKGRDELYTLVFNPLVHSVHLQRDKNNVTVFLNRLFELSEKALKATSAPTTSTESQTNHILALQIGLELHTMCHRWTSQVVQTRYHPKRSIAQAVQFADRLLDPKITESERNYVVALRKYTQNWSVNSQCPIAPQVSASDMPKML